MVNAKLQYLADSILIETLAKDDPIRKYAEEGVIASIGNDVKSYVMSHWDKDRPLESIVAFVGPGLLWSLGFPWLSILYEVADALGFDWKGFWGSVGDTIKEFVHGALSSGKPPSDAEVSAHVDNAITNAAQQNFSGEVDTKKLQDIASRQSMSKSSFNRSLEDAKQLKALAINAGSSEKLLKQAGVLSLFKGKIFRFFVGTITWLIKTALLSLGITGLGGVLASLFGTVPSAAAQPGSHATPATQVEYTEQAPVDMKNVPPDMLTVHRNDQSTVWLEHYPVTQVEDMLVSWTLAVFPQLSADEVRESGSFQSVVNKFRNRNRLGEGMNILAVPRGYQRKIDVVSEIASGISKAQTKPEGKAPETEVVYK